MPTYKHTSKLSAGDSMKAYVKRATKYVTGVAGTPNKCPTTLIRVVDNECVKGLST